MSRAALTPQSGLHRSRACAFARVARRCSALRGYTNDLTPAKVLDLLSQVRAALPRCGRARTRLADCIARR
jgi:hypothetical protein